MKPFFIGLFILMISGFGLAKDKDLQKGLLPELRIDSLNEDDNQQKALKSEILISKSEKQAINSLINIIKKNKGKTQEADLWFRLAELYMRRSKSGRFFDLNRDGDSAVRFAPPEIRDESAVASLRRAIQIYSKIEKEFPRFGSMDEVIFNNAFASHQIGIKNNAKELYSRMITRHPNSPLVADALLALGELKYDEQDFKGALEHFSRLEEYPRAKVYSYGLYKGAWTLYNLRRNQDAIDKLIEVVKLHDPAQAENRKVNHNLRAEAVRDLALFFGEINPPEKAYGFFAKICGKDELGEAMVNMGKIYLSHSRMKELNVFLTEYTDKNEMAKQRPRAHLLMIEANESLKARGEVIKQMESVANICKPNSDWRVKNIQNSEEACDYDVPKVTMEIAKKWWELWLKNRSHLDIAELTKRAFSIHLEREDPAKPDLNSRYAFAELLYQLEDFRKASAQYEIVGAKSQDSTIKHDANYASLVSLEKAAAKKKEPKDDDAMLRLAKNYLSFHPNGAQSTQVRFKIGFIAYEKNQYDEAEQWLRPLSGDNKAGEFRRKSEDLVLDILNARKDYAGIKKFAKELLGQNPDEVRKNGLTKIMQEADYSEIQILSQDKDKTAAIDRLSKFFIENKASTKLAKDALWQAVSLSYAAGKIIDGAELSLTYVKNYPEDKRSLDALKDAAKNFADNGYLLPAAAVMEKIIQSSEKDREVYIEAASEIFLLEGLKKQSQDFLKRLLSDKNVANHGKIYAKLLLSMKGQEGSPEFQKIEEKIVALGHEPYASEIKLQRLQALFKAGKMTDAFNVAKPFVAGKADDALRARARLIQAEVLEREFTGTSTKTSISKISVVLSIKTERLDKAQSAYLEAARMTKDPNVKLQTLQGLNRIYTNYVDTVGNPAIKDTLTDEDKKALAAELTKLTAPILDKKLDTDRKLQLLAKDSKAAGSTAADFANLPFKDTVKPSIPALPQSEMAVYIPAIHADPNDISRFESSARDTCDSSIVKEDSLRTVSEKINRCLTLGKLNEAEKLTFWITRREPQLFLGALYLSLIADLKGQYEKSLWLVELSLKRSMNNPAALYQKAHALFRTGDLAAANSYYLKAGDLGLKARETALVKGLVSFAQGDCLSMLEIFEPLELSIQDKFSLLPAMGECYALKGNNEKSVKFMTEILKSKRESLSSWLQLARIYEVYLFDSNKAISAYESATKYANNPEIKDWLQRKIQFLKGGLSPKTSTHSEIPSNRLYGAVFTCLDQSPGGHQ